MNIESHKIEVGVLQQKQSAALQNVMSTLSGQMVEEYDQQLAIHNSELMTLNQEKIALRENRSHVTQALASGTPRSFFLDDQGQISTQGHIEVKGTLVSSSAYHKIKSQLQNHNVKVDSIQGHQGQYFVPDNLVQAFEEKIDNQLQDKNNLSEMKMIRFQSLIDARKQSLLLLSNMMNSDHQTKMAIIANLK